MWPVGNTGRAWAEKGCYEEPWDEGKAMLTLEDIKNHWRRPARSYAKKGKGAQPL